MLTSITKKSVITTIVVMGMNFFSSNLVYAYDGYGKPYPGQERYHNWEAYQYREHYHPYRDYEGSHRWRNQFQRKGDEMLGRAREWNREGHHGSSPYESECNRVGCE